jgi:hypothetical protein
MCGMRALAGNQTHTPGFVMKSCRQANAGFYRP